MTPKSRRRLLNAVVFFAQKTMHCDKAKLFKLLYMLDFEHFRMTGLSVTGADYAAWKFGPVPEVLQEELEDPDPDFRHALSFVQDRRRDAIRYFVRPLVDFDEASFTERQLRLMADLASKFREVPGDAIDVWNAFHGAWMRVWAEGAGRNKKIPYELALDETASSMAARERQRLEAQRLAAHRALFSS